MSRASLCLACCAFMCYCKLWLLVLPQAVRYNGCHLSMLDLSVYLPVLPCLVLDCLVMSCVVMACPVCLYKCLSVCLIVLSAFLSDFLSACLPACLLFLHACKVACLFDWVCCLCVCMYLRGVLGVVCCPC